MAGVEDEPGVGSESVSAAVVEEVAGPGGGAVALRISGDLDIASAADVRPAVEAVLDRNPTAVVFDLTDLRFMDSSGIALLLTAAARVGRVELHGASSAVRRLIVLTGLEDTLRLTS